MTYPLDIISSDFVFFDDLVCCFSCLHCCKKPTSSAIDRPSETRTYGRQSCDQGTNEIFPRSCGDDRVGSTTHRWPVICEQDKHRLDTTTCIVWQLFFQPKMSDHFTE
jgi:hypothetical protein